MKLLRSMAFWTISLPFALALVAQMGFIVHQIALLEPKIGLGSAGFAVSVMTFMAIAGRLGLGMVVDRFDPRLVTAVSLISQAAALLLTRQRDSAADDSGCLRRLRFFSRQSHYPAAADHASRIQRRGLCRRHGTVECDQWHRRCAGSRLGRRYQSWSSDDEGALRVCIVLELIAAVIVAAPGVDGREIVGCGKAKQATSRIVMTLIG